MNVFNAHTAWEISLTKQLALICIDLISTKDRRFIQATCVTEDYQIFTEWFFSLKMHFKKDSFKKVLV